MKKIVNIILSILMAGVLAVSCKDDTIGGNKFEASLLEYSDKVYNGGEFSMTFSVNHDFYVTEYKVKSSGADFVEESFYDDDIIHVDSARRGEFYSADNNKRISFVISGTNKIIVNSNGKLSFSITLCSRTTEESKTFSGVIKVFEQGGISVEIANENIPSLKGQEIYTDQNGISHRNLPCIIDGQNLHIKVNIPKGHHFRFLSINSDGLIPRESLSMFNSGTSYEVTSVKGEMDFITAPVSIASNRLSSNPLAISVNIEDTDTGEKYRKVLYAYGFSTFRPKIRVKDGKITDGQRIRLLVSSNRSEFDTTGVAVPHSLKISNLQIGNYNEKTFNRNVPGGYDLYNDFDFVWDTPEVAYGTLESISITGSSTTEIYSKQDITVTDNQLGVQLIGTFYDSDYSQTTVADTCYFDAYIKPTTKSFYVKFNHEKSPGYEISLADTTNYKKQDKVQEFIVHTGDKLVFDIITSMTTDSQSFRAYWESKKNSCGLKIDNETSGSTIGDGKKVSYSFTVDALNVYPNIKSATEQILVLVPDKDDVAIQYRIKFIVIPSVWLVLEGTFNYRSVSGATYNSKPKYPHRTDTWHLIMLNKTGDEKRQMMTNAMTDFTWEGSPETMTVKLYRATSSSTTKPANAFSINNDQFQFSVIPEIVGYPSSYYFGVNAAAGKKNWGGYHKGDGTDALSRPAATQPQEIKKNEILHTMSNGSASIDPSIITAFRNWNPCFYGEYYYWWHSGIGTDHSCEYKAINGSDWKEKGIVNKAELTIQVTPEVRLEKTRTKSYWILGALYSIPYAWWNPLIGDVSWQP